MNAEQLIALHEFYQSKLARTILANPQLVPSFRKVSNAIVELIDQNILFVRNKIDLTKESAFIEDELHHPDYFGRLTSTHESCGIPIKTLNDLKKILLDEKSPLELVMHVHALFMWKIYDKLPNPVPASMKTRPNSGDKLSFSQIIANELIAKPEEAKKIKQKAAKIIFENELFYRNDKLDRARKETARPKRTDYVGIVRNKFFEFFTEQFSYTYLRAADRFIPDPTSNYTIAANKMNIPLVAGPSGNGGGLLLCAAMCGNLSQDELQQYALATIGYLVGGGNHAFHEVSIVYSKAGLPHTLGQYDNTLPETFKNSAAYRNLKASFKQLLLDHAQQKYYEDLNYDFSIYENLYQQFTDESIKLDYVLSKNGTCTYYWREFNALGLTQDKQEDLYTCKKITSTSNSKQFIDTRKQDPSFSIDSFMQLCIFAGAKLGFLKYKTPITIETTPIFDQGHVREELAKNVVYKKLGISLDAFLKELCGAKVLSKQCDATAIKNFIIAIANKDLPESYGKAYNYILDNVKPIKRGKEIAKLANQYEAEYQQFGYKHKIW